VMGACLLFHVVAEAPVKTVKDQLFPFWASMVH
jgi:hypothetical protein